MKPTVLLDRSTTPGLGYTLRETLRHVAADATVVVAELVPAVIAWNRDPAYRLAADVIDDPRVEIVAGDVSDAIAAGRGRFDCVMLDVDNGAAESFGHEAKKRRPKARRGAHSSR